MKTNHSLLKMDLNILKLRIEYNMMKLYEIFGSEYGWKRRIKRDIKDSFYEYFEGSVVFSHMGFDDSGEEDTIYETIKPVVDTKVSSFGISKVKYFFKKDVIILKLHMKKCGVFIGHGAKCLRKLENYLTKNVGSTVKIEVSEDKNFEDKLWDTK
jgi:hypothetical protein